MVACGHSAKQPERRLDLVPAIDRMIARTAPSDLVAIDSRMALGRFDSLHVAIDASATYRETAMDDAVLAIAYARIGDAVAARRYAEHAAMPSATPTSGEIDRYVRCTLAKVWELLGDDKRADGLLGTDSNYHCVAELAACAARAGHHDRAMALAKRAASATDSDALEEALLDVADAYIAANDVGHARAALVELQRVEPDPPVWAYHLATRFAKIGDVAAAAAAMKPMLDAAARDEFLSERATEVVDGAVAAGLTAELPRLLARAEALTRNQGVIDQSLVAVEVARYGDPAHAHELVRKVEALPQDPTAGIPPTYYLLDAYLALGDVEAALRAADGDAVRTDGFSRVASYCLTHACPVTPAIDAILAK